MTSHCGINFFLNLVLAFSVCTQAFANTGAAMLTPAGKVSVNGVNTASSSAVLNGDVVSTDPGAAALLSASGTQITLSSQSSLVYGNSSVELRRGIAKVVTSSGAQVRMGAWTVIPTGKRVVYHVANDNGKLLITSKQGSVEVSNGQEKRVVPEGNSVEIIYDHKKKKSAFALSPGNGKFALTVGAAVAAAGVILLRPGSSATKPRTAISPVQP